jgi:hypothetical protein
MWALAISGDGLWQVVTVHAPDEAVGLVCNRRHPSTNSRRVSTQHTARTH